ncbi:MAG TPA: glycosyltransferase [bacterium]|nr:glycosyltransferase [bacterium]
MKILQAFKRIGFEVDVVSGYAGERRKRIKEILEKIESGLRYEFCYSESSTMPTALTEKHHFPIAPFLDFNFIKKLKKHSIPTGLFYRDIHWAFDQYKKNTGFIKRMTAICFYRYDLYKYDKLFDALFLPSLKMRDFIPGKIKIKEVHALPPGCEEKVLSDKKMQGADGILNLIYAGGIKPPLYDLQPLFKSLKGRKNVNLFLICRPDEYKATERYYNISENTNIKVIHGTGSKIEDYFLRSDIYVILWKPFEYLSFAYPYKLFEALTYDLPVITTTGTATADFVLSNNIGWVADGDESDILDNIISEPKLLVEKKDNILKIKGENTWNARALYVEKIFKKIRNEKLS